MLYGRDSVQVLTAVVWLPSSEEPINSITAARFRHFSMRMTDSDLKQYDWRRRRLCDGGFGVYPSDISHPCFTLFGKKQQLPGV